MNINNEIHWTTKECFDKIQNGTYVKNFIEEQFNYPMMTACRRNNTVRQIEQVGAKLRWLMLRSSVNALVDKSNN